MEAGQPPRPDQPRTRVTLPPSGRPPETDAARAAPGDRPRAGGGSLPRAWPPWLATLEDLLTRAVVAGLVALVVIQSLMAGNGPLAYETYGRVLEEWGYRPGMPTGGALGEAPAAAPAGSSAAPAGSPAPVAQPASGVGGAAAGTGASYAQALLTFANRGPSSVALLFNGVELTQLVPGDVRPVVVRPGDRLALRTPPGGGAEVVLTRASGPIAVPTPGATWRVGPQGTAVRVAWRGP
ncbi:MAG TPA: hypothetical protein VIL40_05235 [Thermaerobacter sp.]